MDNLFTHALNVLSTLYMQSTIEDNKGSTCIKKTQFDSLLKYIVMTKNLSF